MALVTRINCMVVVSVQAAHEPLPAGEPALTVFNRPRPLPSRPGLARRRLVEDSQHIGYEENHQYGTYPHARAPSPAPPGVAVIPSTNAKNQQQNDN